MRILIVEDERALCDAIARSLRNLAYSVDYCHDGQEALDLLDIEAFDLVVLDLNLPRIDGMTVLRELRKTDCETKVLILSARGEVSDKVAGLDAGANDYLTKPFHLDELAARIRSLTLRRFTQSDIVLTCGKLRFDTKARIASVDSEALSDALTTCDTSNTTMIAYSTLVPDCSTIDYFIGIDSYTNGQIQAKYLEQKLGLKKTKKSFNLEIFHQSNSGSALYAFLGAMDVLKPYLDNSTLVIPSARVTAEACGVADGAEAKQELSHLLESTYADGKPLDAILCTDDTLSVAVSQELEKEYAGSVFPLISGCNCNPESIQLLIDGKLSVTSVENTQKIAQQAAKMADQAMQGKTVEQSKQNPYDVAAYVYEPVKVTSKNYKDVLFKTGLYKQNKDGTITHAAHKTPDTTEDSKDKTATDQKKTDDKTKAADIPWEIIVA